MVSSHLGSVTDLRRRPGVHGGACGQQWSRLPAPEAEATAGGAEEFPRCRILRGHHVDQARHHLRRRDHGRDRRSRRLLVAVGAVRAEQGPGGIVAEPNGWPDRAGAGLDTKPRFVDLLRDRVAIAVTLFMGLQSLSYSAFLTWIPTVLQAAGVSAHPGRGDARLLESARDHHGRLRAGRRASHQAYLDPGDRDRRALRRGLRRSHRSTGRRGVDLDDVARTRPEKERSVCR